MSEHCAHCDFRFDHDPETEAPRGARCARPASLIIVWKDGRFSYGCSRHGAESIDSDRRELIKEVIVMGKEQS